MRRGMQRWSPRPEQGQFSKSKFISFPFIRHRPARNRIKGGIKKIFGIRLQRRKKMEKLWEFYLILRFTENFAKKTNFSSLFSLFSLIFSKYADIVKKCVFFLDNAGISAKL
jgi:hypothetical protein